MIVIGLTGGIASGKSTVRALLAEQGIPAVDADHIAHALLANPSDCVAQIVDVFGEHIRAPNGGIDRRALGQIVFNDEAARHRLEDIMHPQIAGQANMQLRQLWEDTRPPYLIYEASLLIEVRQKQQQSSQERPQPQGSRSPVSPMQLSHSQLSHSQLSSVQSYQVQCDAIVLVVSPREQRIQRLTETRGYSVEQAEGRINAQWEDARKMEHADILLHNDGDLSKLRREVLALHRDLVTLSTSIDST